MRLIRLAVVLTLLSALIVPGLTAYAAAPAPGAVAGDIREALFDAQQTITSNPAQAAQKLKAAQGLYSGDFADKIKTAIPDADTRIRDGFETAAEALSSGRATDFAAARAQIWTGILAGGYAVVDQSLSQGDGATAQTWLAVREFRVTTRFSRPSSDATQAIAGFQKGTVSQQEAQLALKTDLLDTYQARLAETLRDLSEADSSGFPIRRAELAGTAEGYFAILAPAFAEQRGPATEQTASEAFGQLRASAVSGESVAPLLTRINELLLNFRAAPLSPAEQARRAGQLLRYLNLVSVEYGRGVTDGHVTRDFEVQEAVTFYDGAYAAFTDLQSLLDARDHAQTANTQHQLESLGAQLKEASRSANVPKVEAIQAQTDGLSSQLKAIMPAEWLSSGSAGSDFDVVGSLLDQMEAAARSGDYNAAESSRLEAYAIIETGPEARLMAFAPELNQRLEELFWNGQGQYKGLAYLIQNRASASAIRTSRHQLDASLNEAQTTLGASASPVATAANAGMIMFREGLEAIIILASLMGSLKSAKERQYRKPMWIGAVAALVATCLTWLLARDVLQSLARYGEALEAVVSLIAVAVLLLIMNWFFHKFYWTGWLASFHARKRRLLSGEAGIWVGLVTLGFTSIYREGFETVLFLQALVLENGTSTVLIGVGAGLAAVILVGAITFWLQVNLPYKKMLVLTGMLVGAVLLQMVGMTVHVMQLVGWLPIDVIQGVSLPFWLGTWLGIYPTWEGVLAQIMAAAFVIGTYYIAEAQQKNQRSQRSDIEAVKPVT